MVWLIIIVSYLTGSIPTSYILGRVITGRDIRSMGDTNAGAANAWRTLGRYAGVIVFLVDAAKGAAVILIAKAAGLEQIYVLAAGLAAVTGHNWPVFLGFRGGRGVSTVIGILLVLVPIPMAILAVPTIAIIFKTHVVTPGMAFLYIALPAVEWLCDVPWPYIVYGLVLAIIVGITSFFRTKNHLLKTA